jgi:hypothetical protein
MRMRMKMFHASCFLDTFLLLLLLPLLLHMFAEEEEEEKEGDEDKDEDEDGKQPSLEQLRALARVFVPKKVEEYYAEVGFLGVRVCYECGM